MTLTVLRSGSLCNRPVCARLPVLNHDVMKTLIRHSRNLVIHQPIHVVASQQISGIHSKISAKGKENLYKSKSINNVESPPVSLELLF